MDTKNFIVKYDNVEYTAHPAFDPAIDPRSQVEIANSKPNCNYITYQNGARNKLDLRFAKPEDHININFDIESNHGLNNITDVYINSMNMRNIFFFTKQPLKNTTLHINMNHCNVNMNNFKITPQNAQYINDLNAFIPTLSTENNETIFKAISFENMSFTLSPQIKKLCQESNIKSYGMICDETARQGYLTSCKAQKAVQVIKNKPLSKLNIKTTKVNLTIEK